MKVEKTKISLKTSDWKFKIRSEGRRMKIYIKLNKAETQRWVDIKEAITGGDNTAVSDPEFAKIILFRGLNAFMDDIHKALDNMDEEEKQKILEEAGVEENVEVDVPTIPKLGPASAISDEIDKSDGEFARSDAKLSTEE